MNGAIISWGSKKQQTVSTSTMKVEYIALGYATQKMWVSKDFSISWGLQSLSGPALYTKTTK